MMAENQKCQCGGPLIPLCQETHQHQDGSVYTWTDYLCGRCGAWAEPATAQAHRIQPYPMALRTDGRWSCTIKLGDEDD